MEIIDLILSLSPDTNYIYHYEKLPLHNVLQNDLHIILIEFELLYYHVADKTLLSTIHEYISDDLLKKIILRDKYN